MKQTLLILFLCCWGSLFLHGQSINSVVPNQNPILSGTNLTVNISGSGTNFTTGSSTYVTATTNNGTLLYGQINQNTVTNTNLDVDFYIQCNSCGNVDLSVTTLIDGQLNYTNAFTVTCPQITTVTPNTGSAGQNLSIGISGTNMNFTQGTRTYIYFYNSTTGDYMYPTNLNGGTVDSTNIDLNIPTNNCGGSYDLVVYPDYNSCAIISPNAFNVTGNNGQITLVNPDTIQAGQNLPIQISGSGVDFTQGSLTVFFKSNASTNVYYPSTYNAVSANGVTVDLFTPNNICIGDYDVCVQETPNSCPVCFEDGLHVLPPTIPASITNVTSTPTQAQAGQSLDLTISGTGINFSQGSGMYFVLRNTTTGVTTNTSFQIPANPNQTTVIFGSMPHSCGSYDLEIYNTSSCSNTSLTYPNVATITSTLNPRLFYATPAPAPSAGQLRLLLSGLDIDFMQGSSTLSVRLISPSTGTILTGSNILPTSWGSSNATVDFSPTASQCGYYNIEISNVPTGCGGTTTVTSSQLIGVNIANCNSNTPLQTVLNAHSVRSNSRQSRVFNRPNDEDTADKVHDLEVLDASKLENEEFSVQVYPNPMRQSATILVQGAEQQVLNFALYDLLGQVVKQTEFTTNETLSINRNNLPAGMYIYRVLDATGQPLHSGKIEMQ